MKLVEDLVFGFGFDGERILRLTPRRIVWWHQRAHAFRKRVEPKP